MGSLKVRVMQNWPKHNEYTTPEEGIYLHTARKDGPETSLGTLSLEEANHLAIHLHDAVLEYHNAAAEYERTHAKLPKPVGSIIQLKEDHSLVYVRTGENLWYSIKTGFSTIRDEDFSSNMYETVYEPGVFA